MLSTEASKNAYAKIQRKISLGENIVISPQGSSMFPFLKAGRDRVLLIPVTPAKLPRRGDIVLYRRKNGLLVLHRLHHHDHTGYYFVGDNQTKLEGPLEKSQLLGVVSRIYRQDKSFSSHHPIYWTAGKLWLWLRPIRHVISKRAKRILIFLHLWREPEN